MRVGLGGSSQRCAPENYYRKRNSYELFVISWHNNVHMHKRATHTADTYIMCVCILFLFGSRALDAAVSSYETRDEHLMKPFPHRGSLSCLIELGTASAWRAPPPLILFYNVVYKCRQEKRERKKENEKILRFTGTRAAHQGRINHPHTR